MKNTKFYKYLLPYWKIVALILLLGGATMSLGMVNPYFAKLTIDNAYGRRDLRLFLVLSALAAAIFLINNLLDFARNYLSKYLNRNVNFDVTKVLFRHIQRLSFGFHAERSSGEYVYRVRSDTEMISSFLCDTVPRIPVFILRFLMTLAVVFYLNWKLGILVVALIPLSYVHSRILAKWIEKIARSRMAKIQELFKGLHEIFSHMHLIKSLGKEKHAIRKFETCMKDVVEIELKDAKVASLFNLFGSVVNKMMSGLIILYGGYQIIKGEMTLGSLTAIAIYVAQLMSILREFYSLSRNAIVTRVAYGRVGEILEAPAGISDSPDAVEHIMTGGSVEFSDVVFRYQKAHTILEGLSFSIEPFSKAALVGLSGRGKTTILSLISRLYEPERGAILVDGIDIRKIKLDSLKSQIGIALQQAFLWDDTIMNNILYGAEDATREDAIEAARLAEAHGFIINFSGGYDSMIGETGQKLSEGQKQRIAIARTLIRKPKILILDEAMSSLDSETEDRIIKNIKTVLDDTTVIIVSHRLSAVRSMDSVYFLKSPSVVESGTHEELIKRCPEYSELFASQIGQDEAKEIMAA